MKVRMAGKENKSTFSRALPLRFAGRWHMALKRTDPRRPMRVYVSPNRKARMARFYALLPPLTCNSPKIWHRLFPTINREG